MKAEQAKSLIGKYGIFQIDDDVTDNGVEAVSASGRFVQLRYRGWVSIERVSFIEELPNDPMASLPAPATATGTLANIQKLQVENASLNEQLSQEKAAHATAVAGLSDLLSQRRKEIEGLKAALTAEDAAKAPPAADPGTLSFPTGGAAG